MATITEERNGTEAELGHGPILNKGIFDIWPARENDKVYRPVCSDDPAIQSLSQDIREHGVLEPLVISTDDYIISGHRRYVAARLAGLSEVPCRVLPISRDYDPDKFIKFLIAYNNQREKSFDEKFREALLSIDSHDAYTRMVSTRQEKSSVRLKPLDITGEKARATISPAKMPFLAAIEKAIEEREEFWPLSVRQVHYALLNDPPLKHASKSDSRYANDKCSYKALAELLTRARLEGLISWDAVDDETRPVEIWDVHRDVQSFLRKQMQGFLQGYYRDLMQSQPNHIEAVVEKNTVLPIIKPIAAEFCIPITSGRGFCSTPPRRNMFKRYRDSGKEKLVLLIVSDFDPDGEEIAHSFARSMRDDFGIKKVHAVKVALDAQQVKRYKLPNAMEAKTTSANAAKFIAKFGANTFELEALQPKVLQQIFRDAVTKSIDVEAYNHEVAAEQEDAANIDARRAVLIESLGGWQEGNE